MPRVSAGVLLLRRDPMQFLLVHPGGPFWARRDAGAWSIPKGQLEAGESPRAAALRELEEETGWEVTADLHDLGTVRQKSGKVVHAFAGLQDVDPETLRPHFIDIEWPPRSGLTRSIPEVDRAAWFDLATARTKINPAQAAFLDRAASVLA